MMSVAFSLTGAATAESDAALKKSLKKARDAIASVRTAMTRLRVISAGGAKPGHLAARPDEFRLGLETFLMFENELTAARDALSLLLRGKKFRHAMSCKALAFGYPEIQAFVTEIASDYIPLIRQLRLALIWEIGLRAEAAGMRVIDLSAAFRRSFLSAPLRETTGWQETAFLLADIEAAARLDRSIRAPAHERMEM